MFRPHPLAHRYNVVTKQEDNTMTKLQLTSLVAPATGAFLVLFLSPVVPSVLLFFPFFVTLAVYAAMLVKEEEETTPLTWEDVVWEETYYFGDEVHLCMRLISNSVDEEHAFSQAAMFERQALAVEKIRIRRLTRLAEEAKRVTAC